MENLVTFGDSYTDESRLYYFAEHGHAPPPGTLLPPDEKAFGGGHTWSRVVASETGARFYNYAVAGAMCADNITSHWFEPINDTFPSVVDYEIPAYKADLPFTDLYPDRRPENTVYALWIGTNDLGIDGFLSDSNVRGTSLSTFVDCVWQTFDNIYETGGRNFVLLNIVPLEYSPAYAQPDVGGVGDHQFWEDKSRYNMTEYAYKMFEYSTSVNRLFDIGAEYHLLLKKRWPGATFTVFDVNSLFQDIRADPVKFLDQPANATYPWRRCVTGSDCKTSELPLSNYLW
jgi:phospholipase/lecithinase/hemolysin